MISDTHSMHGFLKNLPDADMIVHSGDVSKRGTKQQVQDFVYWYSKLPYKYKVFIAGNHDFLFEDHAEVAKSLIPSNLIYLENSAIEIEGLRIWGSPITPWFHSWAFNRYRGDAIDKYWQQIPSDVEFLVTHGPPAMILDEVNNYYSPVKNVGCSNLKDKLFTLKDLKLMQFGHIHEAAGVAKLYNNYNEVTCVNASSVDVNYEMQTKPYHLYEVTGEKNIIQL